jgi:hypothetical protein
VNILIIFFLKENVMILLSVFPTKVLEVENQKVISDGALVAITLMFAESNPEEKDIMTTLIMNLLKM